jgi:hypothetical protein
MRTVDDAPLPMAVYAETVERIRESNIPILVQLFDLNRLPPEFQHTIRGAHEVFFSNDLGMASEPLSTYGS